MKRIHNLLLLPMVLLAMVFTACDRDYDMPPLNEPSYSLPADAQVITVADLRTRYAAATSTEAITIEDSLFLKARIAGDDRSGNIFKSLYIQDETGGITMLVDQSGVYNDYAAGQEVFVDLKGLCISVYGNEQQIGHPSGYLYRTPYEDFKAHVHCNGWADESKIDIKEFDNISRLSDAADANKFTLVRLTGVHFVQGGQVNFAEASGSGTRALSDAYGNTISVRTSNYADFAATKLPVGTGNVIAILGRFNGNWQLTIRSINDVYGFDGIEPGQGGEGGGEGEGGGGETGGSEADGSTVIFEETFGESVSKGSDGYWPSITYNTWTSTSGLTISDPVMEANGWSYSNASVRQTSALNPHVWFAANKEAEMKIEGFDTTGYTDLKLSYKITANADGNQSVIGVSWGGTKLTVPDVAIATTNTYQTVELTGLAAGVNSVSFISSASTNTAGYRIDDIKLTGKKQ